MTLSLSRSRLLRGVVLLSLLAASTTAPGADRAAASPHPGTVAEQWLWPVPAPVVVIEPFHEPSHAYGAGHRGIDVAVGPDSRAALAPADGVVAFSGTVVDRPLITIEHADGLVTTLEPVQSDLTAGTAVQAGQRVGTVVVGGHAAADSVHFGVRRDGVYINPLELLGGIPRAVLLPCCEDVP